jgi:alpha-tubulin suppressor-like RCC1 family protein
VLLQPNSGGRHDWNPGAAGGGQSFALTWAGRLYSWGSNYYGELGLGDKRGRRVPKLVEGLEGVCSVASGHCHNLARQVRVPSSAGV